MKFEWSMENMSNTGKIFLRNSTISSFQIDVYLGKWTPRSFFFLAF